MPQIEAPSDFVEVLEEFLAETPPAEWDTAQWRARMAVSGKG